MIPAEETPSSSWTSKIATPQSAETLGRLRCVAVKRVKAELTDGFDFSATLPTPLEVMAIRAALEAGLLGFPSHAVPIIDVMSDGSEVFSTSTALFLDKILDSALALKLPRVELRFVPKVLRTSRIPPRKAA